MYNPITITDNGQFLLEHPVGPDELFDSFEDLVESHPILEQFRGEVFGAAAFHAAQEEGLQFHWAVCHVGHTFSFIGNCWEDGGVTVSGDGVPVLDSFGNSIGLARVEPLDRNNPQHVQRVLEWYGE